MKIFLVRREVLYNILIEFGIPMKLVRIVKMCLNETYSKVCLGKNLSDSFPIQSDLNKEMLTVTAFQICFRIYRQKGSRKLGMEHIGCWYVLMMLIHERIYKYRN
jgi:hypothetical protein